MRQETWMVPKTIDGYVERMNDRVDMQEKNSTRSSGQHATCKESTQARNEKYMQQNITH